MNREDLLEGEVIVLKRMLALAVLVGAPALWALGMLSIVNLALLAGALFLAANVLVGLVLKFRPDIAQMMAMGQELDDDQARELAEDMLGMGGDDDEP